MRSLAFAPAGLGSKAPRAARFEERSSLPTSAACVVASGVRETLTALFGTPVGVRLFEPVIPSPAAWAEIARGAALYRVRGSVADAAIVLRPADALALASAAFGESIDTNAAQRPLSPMERDVLDRTVGAIAGSLTAVCGGREGAAIERTGALAGFVTYFELVLGAPVDARIGIALSRDPVPERRGGLRIADVGDVGVNACVQLDVESITAAAVTAFAPGTFVPLAHGREFRAALAVGGRVLARGSCGTRNGRYAFTVEAARR